MGNNLREERATQGGMENHSSLVSLSCKNYCFSFPSPRVTKAGERNPFSALFVVRLVFRTQPHRQFPPKPCFNLIMMRFADTMNI